LPVGKLKTPTGEGFAENRTNRTSRPSQIYSLMNGASSMMNYQYAIRYTLHAVRFALYASRSASIERAQKNLFMQNKPNFPRFCAKNGYLGEKQTQSNPIQSQFKPNLKKAEMKLTSLKTKDYEKNDIFSVPQNKANSNPIQTQFQTRFAENKPK